MDKPTRDDTVWKTISARPHMIKPANALAQRAFRLIAGAHNQLNLLPRAIG
jgi:hypothetical protein